MKDKLAVADRLKGRKLGIEPLVEPSSHLRHPPLLDHSGHATCDAIVQDASRKGQTDAQSREGRSAERPLGDPLGKRLSRDDRYFQRAQNPLGVARHQPRVGRRIAAPQLLEEDRQPLRGEARPQLGPDGFVTGGDRADPLQERPQVETAPPHHDRPASARLDLGDRSARLTGELPGRPALAGIEDVDQVVRNSLAFGRAGFRRADVETPVGLERVGVDDLAAERLGEREAERALARGGRAEDDEEGGGVHRCVGAGFPRP